MSTTSRLALALAVCALLAGCGGGGEQPAPPPAPMAEAAPPPPPPPPAASYDGVYAGSIVRVRTPTPRACVPTHHATLRIAGGAFTYRAGLAAPVHVAVEPGGAFEGTRADLSVKGQIGADGHLTGTADGKDCGYTLDLQKH
jgi:hypothetical protein